MTDIYFFECDLCATKEGESHKVDITISSQKIYPHQYTLKICETCRVQKLTTDGKKTW